MDLQKLLSYKEVGVVWLGKVRVCYAKIDCEFLRNTVACYSTAQKGSFEIYAQDKKSY